ncbi:MAG: NCS2 family permease [Fibromonadaceae bacterium]|jgi:AGZA family xanthine/uracil permease-like MFS transporter|nr:NCS2 family permease [Fibromonadaceae bacterium]
MISYWKGLKMNFIENYFGITKSGSNLYKELVAGVTTFFAMSYILFANPAILSEAGMDKHAQFTATAVATIFGCLVMGIYARLPFALAPGMGLNAFFASTVCISLGHSWKFALTAVFVEGIIFFLLSLFNLRKLVVNMIPRSLQLAFCPGVGFFIAFIGLRQAGIVGMENSISSFENLTNPNVLLTCLGILIMGVFYVKKVYVGMIFGVMLLTIISLSFGVTKIDTFFSAPPSLSGTMLQFDFSQVLSYDFICVVLLLLSVNIFDTTGTFLGISNSNHAEGLLDDSGYLKNIKKAYTAGSLAATFGAMAGTSTTTTYIESSVGVSVGGRTGITSIVTAVCFIISLFSFPLLSAVPPAAVAAMLIFAGYNIFMSPAFKNLDHNDYSESIPAYITIIMMPFAHSIVEGISFGLLSYVLINAFAGNFHKISVGTYCIAAFFAIRYVILGM